MTALVAVAGVLTSISAALLVPPMTGAAVVGATSRRDPGARPTSPKRIVAALAVLGAGLWTVLDGTQLALALIALAATIGVGRLVARSRAAVAAERKADQVLALCDAMASDLAAGQPPLAALDRAAQEWEEFTPVATAGRLGADVPEALRALADRPGGGQLRVLAAAWQVAHRSGAGLADAIAQAAASMREERATGRLVSSELASAHATARMMAALPMGVLLLGSGVGGDPIGFLISTPAGLGCLASGLALSYLGLIWLHRLADGVQAR